MKGIITGLVILAIFVCLGAAALSSLANDIGDAFGLGGGARSAQTATARCTGLCVNSGNVYQTATNTTNDKDDHGRMTKGEVLVIFLLMLVFITVSVLVIRSIFRIE